MPHGFCLRFVQNSKINFAIFAEKITNKLQPSAHIAPNNQNAGQRVQCRLYPHLPQFKTDYIKTSMPIHKSGIGKGEITDHTILANCRAKIKHYAQKLNDFNLDNWTAKEIKQFLLSDTIDISFSDFARKHIDKMKIDGRRKPANNYTFALNSLEKYYGKNITLFRYNFKGFKEMDRKFIRHEEGKKHVSVLDKKTVWRRMP
jgi:hypothetical protein